MISLYAHNFFPRKFIGKHFFSSISNTCFDGNDNKTYLRSVYRKCLAQNCICKQSICLLDKTETNYIEKWTYIQMNMRDALRREENR